MSQILKLRPVLKSKEELEDEKKLIFQLPRKNCEQIAPEIKRLNAIQKKQEHNHRIHVLKRIMKHARIKNIEKHLEHLESLDASDKVVPWGEVSKRIYNDIFTTRNFDLYGNPMPDVSYPPRKYMELQQLAQKLNVEFTLKLDEAYKGISHDDEFEAEQQEKEKIEQLKTEKWRIGYVERYNAPVGFASNPTQPFNSLGNEGYFSYDGDWKNGKMEGIGTYLYQDGKTYEGSLKANKQHGKGRAVYPAGQSYDGEWSFGRYCGTGTLTTCTGIKYTGEYEFGRRHGSGKIEYPSGLTYEGQFHDGKPHGRGTMKSKLTGWAYEGTFERGFICGNGKLITPPPECRHIMYYWPENRDPVLLPGLVRYYLDEQIRDRDRRDAQQMEIYGTLRGLQLKNYVSTIRTAIHSEGLRLKKERYQEAMEKAKEQKQKLYEARLKALAGDEETTTTAPSAAATPATTKDRKPSPKSATPKKRAQSPKSGKKERAQSPKSPK